MKWVFVGLLFSGCCWPPSTCASKWGAQERAGIHARDSMYIETSGPQSRCPGSTTCACLEAKVTEGIREVDTKLHLCLAKLIQLCKV